MKLFQGRPFNMWNKAISNHELNAINMANNIETISIIDHWHYYKERFLRNGTYIFPKPLGH